MKTMIIGASTNKSRYSYKATRLLQRYNHEVIPIGIKKGEINGVKIINNKPYFDNIHTVTLYVGQNNQAEYYNYILKLKPKRVIFNPGTENSEFENKLKESGINTIQHCTLVMLNSGEF